MAAGEAQLTDLPGGVVTRPQDVAAQHVAVQNSE
jgi:hypothetical protein